MDRLLTLIPRNLIAFVAIVAGILFVVLSDPPHSVCDSQLEVLRESQKHFLYRDPKQAKILTTKYERMRNHCKLTNDPGGCYELFLEMKRLLNDFNTVSGDCGSAAGSVAEHKKALWETVELLVRFAWGEKAPEAYHAKFGWLDKADMSLFCNLKSKIVSFYGEPAWASFREKMMRELPGAKDAARNHVWDMSLFSENCARYP